MNPINFSSLPTCGFVAQLHPTGIWEARVQAPSKPEFFQAGTCEEQFVANIDINKKKNTVHSVTAKL